MIKAVYDDWAEDCVRCQGDARRVMKIWRLGHYYMTTSDKVLFRKPRLVLYKGLNNYYNRLLHGFEIPLQTFIGKGLRIVHMNGIVVSQYARIGENCTVFQQVTIGAVSGVNGAPQIGNNVYIGDGAKILGAIKIGDNVKIGANAVVTHDIPDNVTVVGINQIIRGRLSEN